MKITKLNTLQEIIEAVEAGKNVNANTALYKVIKNTKNDYYFL
ncbi:hypothetical protein [Belliella pelovolcani]|uniref:Uncharacterized protein n=1 Tax=Belliella pelovolcani TaxID=529505 RepID=A0A1N7MRP2_9BACT|nr:hypothetical protein [Belliella pelovolcani]SIS88796.1 hypothetical protein SAMN05421761_10776 [Belliella pelovolcani]